MNVTAREGIGERANRAAGEPWDVIVIGAGVGGGTAACVAADAGLRVLLVEKSAFPRPKVCGGCLSPRGVRALGRAGLAAVLEGTARVESLSLRWGDRRADTAFGGHRVVDRATLDRALLQQASARGVTTLQPLAAKVVGEGAVQLAGAGVARATAVIVCDGLGGTSLAGRPGFDWEIDPRSRMGLGATLEAQVTSLEAGRLVMRCGEAGYLGVVRLADGRLDVAAAIDAGALRGRGDAGQVMAAHFADTDLPFESLARARWRGTPLLTRRRCRIAGRRTMVVGDAAGYVEPFTGEGMTWAIEGAIEAATLAAMMVRDGRDAGGWATVHERLLASRQRACAMVAGVLRSRTATRGVVALAARFPGLARRGATFVAGVTA